MPGPSPFGPAPADPPADAPWFDRLVPGDPRLSQMRPGHPGFDQYKRMLNDRSGHSLQDGIFSIPGLEWLFRRLPGFKAMPPQKFDGWIDMGEPRAPDATRGKTIDPQDITNTMGRRLEGRREERDL
jgi:hypothetical protein